MRFTVLAAAILVSTLATLALADEPDEPTASVDGETDAAEPSGVTPESVSPDVSRSPFDAVPDGDSVLSVFDDSGDKCHWLRFDPVARKSSEIAVFDVCPSPVAWSHDGRKAMGKVVDKRQRTSLVIVDIATREIEVTKAPPHTETFGFDSKDRPWALTFDGNEKPLDGFFTWKGKKIPAGNLDFGSAGLARAWMLKDGRWHDVAAKGSEGEACDTLGARVFDIVREFGFDTDDRAEGDPRWSDGLDEKDPLLKHLHAAAAAADQDFEGEWRVIPSQTKDSYVHFGVGDGKITDPDVFAFVDGESVTILPARRVLFRGNYVIVDGSFFDAQTRQPIFQSAPGTITFWPNAASAAQKAAAERRVDAHRKRREAAAAAREKSGVQ